MIIPPWAYIAAGGLALAGGFGAGWQVRAWKADADIASIHEGYQKALAEQLARADAAAVRYEGQSAQIQRDIIRLPAEVRTIYETVTVPAACEPSPDALRLLDRAISGADTTGEPETALP